MIAAWVNTPTFRLIYDQTVNCQAKMAYEDVSEPGDVRRKRQPLIRGARRSPLLHARDSRDIGYV